MAGPPLDRDAVARLAELAQLDLSAADLARVTSELVAIVAYAEELAGVDVEGVAPMDRPLTGDEPGGEAPLPDDVLRDARLPDDGLRDDVPAEEIARERALAEAPRASEGGFEVPTFVDEG